MPKSIPAADRLSPTPDFVTPLIARAFPSARILDCQKLTGGLINTNLKIQLSSPDQLLVLRIYERDNEACAKEVELLQLVRQTVPVADVLYAEPDASPPFALLSYIEGITFRQLKGAGDTTAIRQAAYSIGKTLAAIGNYKFAQTGRLGPDLKVTGKFVEGPNPVPQFLDRCLASSVLQDRVSDEIQRRLHDFIWSSAPRLANLDHERALVHCDFGSRNLLVKPDKEKAGAWEVAGVIDWEFALSGSPLFDLGHFLRYERTEQPLREPHFSRGYLEGGATLPEDWRHLARAIDLTALVELLTRTNVPAEILAEVLDLVEATFTRSDPES